jgi:hypothetical protein
MRDTHQDHISSVFFLGGRRDTRTPKHFVNLTGESKNFKMLEFPLNQLPNVLWTFMWFVKFYVVYVGKKDVDFLESN